MSEEAAVEPSSTKTADEAVVAKSSVSKVSKADAKKSASDTRKTTKKVVAKASRGKKYLAVREKIEKDKAYSLKDALQLVKDTSYSKFDGTVEIHVKMAPTRKGDDIQLRGTVRLPAGSPKEKKIVVATEELIETIKKGKIDFDILLATPDLMPKLAVVAKVLGPKGKMPTPKAGTVTTDPEKTKAELSGGLVEYKTDAHAIIHLPVGKVSWDTEKLQENINALLAVIPSKKNIASANVSATMSPGIPLALEK